MIKKERKSPLDKVRQHAISSAFNGNTVCPWSNKIWRKVWNNTFIPLKLQDFYSIKTSSKRLCDLDMSMLRSDRVGHIKKANGLWTCRITSKFTTQQIGA